MNALTPLENNQPPALFASYRSTLNQAAQQGVPASFAVIGYKGRNWRLKYRGEETLLMANGAPLPHLDVIIVGVASGISKIYYEQKYVEGNDDAPDCFSGDGVAPDPASAKPQCVTCAICPHNQWGSHITEAGKKGKACQDSRRIAVVPLQDPRNESFNGPMLLRIPPMSLNQLANYAQLLDRKGASMEFVATRIGFDYDVAYPKLTFEAIGWLSNEQAELVVGNDGTGGICADPVLKYMLYGTVATETVAQPPDQPSDQPSDQPAQSAPAAVFTAQTEAPADAQQKVVNGPINGRAPVQPAHKARKPAAASEPTPAPIAANPFAAAQVVRAPAPAPAPAPANGAALVQDASADLQAAIDALLNDPS